MDTLVHRDTTEQYGYGENGGIFKTTALGAVRKDIMIPLIVFTKEQSHTYGDIR